jgi:hypothetical protein
LHILKCLMMMSHGSEIFFVCFFFLFLRLDNLSWLVLYLFYLELSLSRESFISLSVLFNSRISSWLSLFNNFYSFIFKLFFIFQQIVYWCNEWQNTSTFILDFMVTQ